MPTYFYTARSLKGEPKAGEKKAESRQELSALLLREGYNLVSAVSRDERAEKSSAALPSLFQRVSLTDRIFFTRNLQVMTGAGIALPRSLRTLAGQSGNKKFKKVLESIARDISSGESLSEGISRYPKIFSEFFLTMIKAGEETGDLERVLTGLTRQMEAEYALKAGIEKAIAVPAVVITAMFCGLMFMLFLVVPKISVIFKGWRTELPLTTKFVIGAADVLMHFWYLIPAFLLALFIVLRLGLMTVPGKKAVCFLFLKMPLISQLLRKKHSAYTARTLSSLMAAGVPLAGSLEVISGVLSNFYFKDALKQAAGEVRQGGSLAQGLKLCQNLYSPLFLELLGAAEQKSGQDLNVLERLAAFFEEETDNAAKRLARAAEPVLMVVMGFGIGFFVVAMVQPFFSIV